MAKYRKKPVVIEAFQWTRGPKQMELVVFGLAPEWICDAMRAGSVRLEQAGTPDVTLMIDTLEGTHRANQGDWIIRGVKGELYPCKPDIFAATYEEVSDDSEQEGENEQ
mgnify:CR=1 FL=1